jgi:drug/metabolite transporter (DMT)-like permease
MTTDTDPALRLKQRAIFCVLASSGSFAIAAALVKAIAPTIPTIEIMLFRSLVALLLMLPLLYRNGGLAALRTRHPWGHAARTAAGFAGMFSSFYGYAHLPLAMVTALGFSMPIFLSILSLPLLGERVSAGRAVAVLAGLFGVLVVLRPWRAEGAVELGPALVVVAGVLAWALGMVSIRRMGQAGERNITIVMWFAIAATVISALICIPVWVTPSPLALLALIGVGLISGMAQLLMTEGYRSGEATMLAPFEYGAIVYTVLLGWSIWGEVPGPWEATGIAFLIVSGLVTWWRESRPRSTPASRPPAPATPSRPAFAGPPPSHPIPARRPD